MNILEKLVEFWIVACLITQEWTDIDMRAHLDPD